MTRSTDHNSISAPTDASRRRFLAVTAAASVVSVGALAAAAMPLPAHQSDAAGVAAGMTTPANDVALLELELQIFELKNSAGQYDDEIMRTSEIWTVESNRLYGEALAREAQAGVYLTPQQRWELVTNSPACVEHNRLCELQDPLHRQMEALIAQMWAIPAHTSEGRRAKAAVLISCVMAADWQQVDEMTDRPERMARALLLEFVGGEPGEFLRDQLA
jgi:hypothetical protein